MIRLGSPQLVLNRSSPIPSLFSLGERPVSTMAITLQSVGSVMCGQLVSMFSIIALVLAKFLAERGASTPGLLNLFFYILLGMLCISYSWVREVRSERRASQTGTPVASPLDAYPATPSTDKAAINESSRSSPAYVPWWMYPLAAALDVEANYCAVRALAFADYITVGLMLNLAIPFLSLLCYGINRKSCTYTHIAGCCVALSGCIALLAGAYHQDHSGTSSDKTSFHLYGTLVAFMGAFLYAASNIASEWCLKERTLDGVIETTGYIAVWSTVFSLLHFLALETSTASNIEWTASVGISFLGYATTMITVYALIHCLSQRSSATTYVLGLVASNVYLVATGYYCFGEVGSRACGIALVLILVGLALHASEFSSPAPEAPSMLSQKLRVASIACMPVAPRTITAIKLAPPHAVV